MRTPEATSTVSVRLDEIEWKVGDETLDGRHWGRLTAKNQQGTGNRRADNERKGSATEEGRMNERPYLCDGQCSPSPLRTVEDEVGGEEERVCRAVGRRGGSC